MSTILVFQKVEHKIENVDIGMGAIMYSFISKVYFGFSEIRKEGRAAC